MNSSIKLKTAENLFRNKDWAGASRLLYQVLENESEAKPARLFVLLSAASRHQRKYRESEAIAEEGRRLYPRNKDIGLQYADAATALHDWYAAVDRWNDLIETFGADVPAIAYVRLADAYRHLYKFDESDKAISAGKQLHGEALEKHIHLPVHEEERFLSILDRLPLFNLSLANGSRSFTFRKLNCRPMLRPCYATSRIVLGPSFLSRIRKAMSFLRDASQDLQDTTRSIMRYSNTNGRLKSSS
jgi:hypothetical protein